MCIHNSARSQIAEGLMNHLCGDAFQASSAGTEPGDIHPLAVEVMDEIGIDISGHRSKSVSGFLGRVFDYVVTVCDQAREACPLFYSAREALHQSFEDPTAAQGTYDERLAAFRKARDEIKQWIEKTFFG